MSETAKDGGDSFFAKDSDPLWHSMLMGSLSGAACVIVGHPLDTVKVRLQTSAKGPLFTNLFRGVVPPLLAVTPSWTGVFLVYGGALKVIGSNDLASVTAAGAVSGTIYSVVMCPFEIVKVNAQKAQVSALVAARRLYASVGIRGMYRGFGACLVRDISQSAVYYYCAESLNRSERVSRVCGDATALIAGAITGVAHVSMEFPFDTVKSRFQTNPRLATYSECVRELASKSELRRVSAALIPALSRAVFAHSAAFLAVQAAKDFIIPPSSGTHIKST